jgi:hypothetical protein
MNCFLINQNIKTTTWRETLLTLPKDDLCREYTKKYITMRKYQAKLHLMQYPLHHFYQEFC